MAAAIPVLDADIVTDARRLLNRLMGVHPDVPGRPVPAYPIATAADAAAMNTARDAWWVTARPRGEARHLLILGQLEPRHHDRLHWVTEDGHGYAPPSAAFAVLLRAADAALMYVRVTAPHDMFAGTVLDGELVDVTAAIPGTSTSTRTGTRPTRAFQVHDAVAMNGLIVPPMSRADATAMLDDVAHCVTLECVGLAPIILVRPWRCLATPTLTLDAASDLLFARDARVLNVTTPTHDMVVWERDACLPLGVAAGVPHAYVAELGTGAWLAAPSLPLAGGRPWDGVTGIVTCTLRVESTDTCVCMLTSVPTAASASATPATWADVQAAILPIWLTWRPSSPPPSSPPGPSAAPARRCLREATGSRPRPR